MRSFRFIAASTVLVLTACSGTPAVTGGPSTSANARAGSSTRPTTARSVPEGDPVSEYQLQAVGNASGDVLDSSAEILENRFSDAGISATANTNAQNNAIEVRVYDATDRERIASLITVGELRFRPVLQVLPPEFEPETYTPSEIDQIPTTPPGADDPQSVVVLPEHDPTTDEVVVRYQLGRVELTGSAIDDAKAVLSRQTGKWEVDPIYKAGADGIDAFNAVAKRCRPPSSTCPTGQLAMTLDGRVISAPTIEEGASTFTPFKRDQIVISGNFSETTAKVLAARLRYGALPVELRLTG